MQKAVDRIKGLMHSLPEKDIELGFKFLEIRDFESLKELIDSALILAKKNKRDTLNNNYKNVDIDDLNTLKSEVDTYLIQLNLPSMYIDINDMYESNGVEEEFY